MKLAEAVVENSHFLGALSDPQSNRTLRSLALDLPWSGTAGFECRLSDESREVDLGVLIDAPGFDDGGCLSRRISRVFADWQASHPCLSRLKRMYLEFDARNPGTVRTPNLFFITESRFASHIELNRYVLDGRAPVTEQCLTRLEAALPDEATIWMLGWMLQRDTPGVRVAVSGLTPQGMADLIDALGWSRDELEELGFIERVRTLDQVFRKNALSFEFNEFGLTRRLGLESTCASASPQDWADLLQRWLSEGLCSPDRRAAVLDWTGSAPDTESFKNFLVTGERVETWQRGVSHFKLTLCPQTGWGSKVYLFCVQPSRRRLKHVGN